MLPPVEQKAGRTSHKSKTYEDFVEKFKPKKTTDDCYTPKTVYDAVKKWVIENSEVDISASEIVRPFWPGGDYENYEYPYNCVVIDNPPFSLLSKIVRFYISRDIKFFLFAPHLTVISSVRDTCTILPLGASVIYENGANVCTSFVSNLFRDTVVLLDKNLEEAINAANKENTAKAKLPKYVYPDNVFTVSRAQKIIRGGCSLRILKKSVKFISKLDSQKDVKKTLFGCGFLISDKAAAEMRAAEMRAAEMRAAEMRAAEISDIWTLSEKEEEIIKGLE